MLSFVLLGLQFSGTTNIFSLLMKIDEHLRVLEGKTCVVNFSYLVLIFFLISSEKLAIKARTHIQQPLNYIFFIHILWVDALVLKSL